MLGSVIRYVKLRLTYNSIAEYMYFILKYISTVILPPTPSPYVSILNSLNFLRSAGVLALHISVLTRGGDILSAWLMRTEETMVMKACEGYSELACSSCRRRRWISSCVRLSSST